jgi:hypothetical protein
MVERGTRGWRRRGSVLAAFLLLAACRSPNRGVWQGTFDGSVAGTVEFRISARGASLTGTMEGTTRDRQSFQADLEGTIKGDYFYATFEGTGSAELRPVPFSGFMKGELRDGRGSGDWEATLRFTQQKLRGAWRVEQLSGP